MSPAVCLLSYLLFSVSLFFISTLWLHLALCAVLLAAAALTPGLNTRKGAVFITLFMLFTFAGNMFYGSGRVLLSFGAMHITDAGLVTAGVRTMRVFELIYAARILSAFVPLQEMAEAFRRLMQPFGRLGLPVNDFFFTLGLTLKCLPAVKSRIQADCRRYIDDNALRGSQGRAASIKTVYGFGRGFFPDIIAPLFINSVKHPEQYFSASDESAGACSGKFNRQEASE